MIRAALCRSRNQTPIPDWQFSGHAMRTHLEGVSGTGANEMFNLLAESVQTFNPRSFQPLEFSRSRAIVLRGSS